MKILLADDHALFREGMHYVLRQLDGQVDILDAGNFSEALDMAENNPDINLALLDLKMPGNDGAAPINLFHARCPDIPIVVISGTDRRDDVMWAVNNGAAGFISKASSGKDMLQALRAVLDGGTCMPPQFSEQMIAHSKDGRSRRSNKYGLTGRQMDMLRHLGMGLSNKSIAETTGLSEGTVKIHISGVFQALRVNNRLDAVRAARRLGLIVDEERL